MTTSFRRALLDHASEPYRSAGRFAWHFSRSKLRRDPVFVGLLEKGIIGDASRLVDLGCGQGLLASWLQSARALYDAGNWPHEWPAPPRIDRVLGVELMPNDVERARRALAGRADFRVGDIRSFDYGRAEVVVILDVLHYLDFDDQLKVLRRVRAALPAGGQLVTRVGDGAGGLPFHFSRWVDRAVSAARGHRLPRLCCRSVDDWAQQLEILGFRVESMPMARHTPFANVLLSARVESPAAPGPGSRASIC
jgi:trans-aconitate methyltransferase